MNLLFSLGLRVRVPLDQEKMAVNQKALEMGDQLAMLTAFGRALCNVMLGTGRGDSQLALHLDKAYLQVDPLIFKGVHCSIHAALMLVSSHYGGINFDAIRRGYASGKSNSDILIIGSATAHGAEVLASKVSAAYIRHQY